MTEKEEEQQEQEIVITYEPLGGDPFGPAEMLAQAASALDLAAIFALENKDIKGLTKVAREWTKLGLAAAGLDELPEDSKKNLKFGFGKEIVEEEENGKAASEGDGKDDIQSKGRFRSYRVGSFRPRPRR